MEIEMDSAYFARINEKTLTLSSYLGKNFHIACLELSCNFAFCNQQDIYCNENVFASINFN